MPRNKRCVEGGSTFIEIVTSLGIVIKQRDRRRCVWVQGFKVLVKRMDFERAGLGEDIKAADIVVGPFMAAIIALLPRGRTSFSSHPRDDLRATEPPTQPLTACWGHYAAASRRRRRRRRLYIRVQCTDARTFSTPL